MTTAVCGNNRFLVTRQVQALIDSFVAEHGDLALERLDGEETGRDQILGAVESLPFLASKKMVIVTDLSANKDASQSLEQIIERAGDTTDLILVEHTVDKRSSYYKQLKKLTDFKELNELDETALASWLVDEAKSRNASISSSDARYLIQRIGSDQLRLSNELEKLIQFQPEISRQTIELLTDESPSSTIFNLVDSIFSGNIEKALRIYDEQRKLRVEPQAIQGMLVWQMHTVAIVSAAPAGTTPAQIAKDAGLSPFVVQKSQRIAQVMGRPKILNFMQLLRDIDYRSKREPLDYDEALRYAIISLGK